MCPTQSVKISQIDSPLMLEYVACDYCGSHEHELMYRKLGVAIPIIFNIVKCKHCGLFFTNPRPPIELTPSIYNSAYYAGNGLDSAFVGSSDAKYQDANLLLRCVSDFFNHKPLFMIEVGGGLVC